MAGEVARISRGTLEAPREYEGVTDKADEMAEAGCGIVIVVD